MSDNESAELFVEERTNPDRIVLRQADWTFTLSLDQAMGIGEAMARYAYHAKHKIEKPVAIKTISKLNQEKVENRIALVMGQLQAKKKKPLFIARELFGIFMREVT